MKIQFINNQNASCRLRCGIMVPRDDTSLGPVPAFEQGLADISLSPTHPLVRFSDSQVLMDTWRFLPGTSKEIVLSPGGHYEISAALPSFEYQTQTASSDFLTYRSAYQPAVLVWQMLGVIHTDRVTHAEINFGACNISVTALVIRKIVYAAGANIQRTVVDNNQTSNFSDQGAQINQPASVKQFLT